MNITNGRGTTEFVAGLIAVICTAVQSVFWPNSPFPAEALITLVVWIGARTGEKIIGSGVPEKRAWQTSEFWAGIALAVVQYVWPGIPPSVVGLVYTWIVGRPLVKVTKDVSLSTLLGQK